MKMQNKTLVAIFGIACISFVAIVIKDAGVLWAFILLMIIIELTPEGSVNYGDTSETDENEE